MARDWTPPTHLGIEDRRELEEFYREVQAYDLDSQNAQTNIPQWNPSKFRRADYLFMGHRILRLNGLPDYAAGATRTFSGSWSISNTTGRPWGVPSGLGGSVVIDAGSQVSPILLWLHKAGGFAVDFDIDISNDGSTWTNLFQRETDSSGAFIRDRRSLITGIKMAGWGVYEAQHTFPYSWKPPTWSSGIASIGGFSPATKFLLGFGDTTTWTTPGHGGNGLVDSCHWCFGKITARYWRFSWNSWDGNPLFPEMVSQIRLVGAP
jgi:hypothetical protein